MFKNLRLFTALMNFARSAFVMTGAIACGVVEMRAIAREAMDLKYVCKPFTDAQLADVMRARGVRAPRHETAPRKRPAVSRRQHETPALTSNESAAAVA